ncbi:MAG: hypothetical protein HYV65_02100 [Candidatus Spechtbacteria bacterium]|nr:hypothetical protein [Candidatus Spechtbacteria bacterium]
MVREIHGPHIHVERHPEGGYVINKKALSILFFLLFLIASLLFLSFYFVYDSRSQLSRSLSAQALLQRDSDILTKVNFDLQDRLAYAEYEIFDMRLEVNSLAAQYLPSLIIGTLTARETFSGFVVAINQGEYKVAYRLTDSEYRTSCSEEQFIDAIKTSRTVFPLMKFEGEIIRPDLQAAIVRYNISQNGNIFQVDAALILDNDHWAVPVGTEDCGAVDSDLGSILGIEGIN